MTGRGGKLDCWWNQNQEMGEPREKPKKFSVSTTVSTLLITGFESLITISQSSNQLSYQDGMNITKEHQHPLILVKVTDISSPSLSFPKSAHLKTVYSIERKHMLTFKILNFS